MVSAYPAIEEDSQFREFVFNTSTQDADTEFEDPLYQRFADALKFNSSDRDIGILLRQVIRRNFLHESASEKLKLRNELFEQLRHISSDMGLTFNEANRTVSAKPWKPQWLPNPNNRDVDLACVAGTPKGERADWRIGKTAPIPADPQFTEMPPGTYVNYRTIGQQHAARAIHSLPKGGVLFTILPTGSGKTSVAETIAYKNFKGGQSTVIVVPTIALAHDLDHRLRANYESIPDLNQRVLSGSWAWTTGLSDDRRSELATGLELGKLPFLITSPESLTQNGQLRTALWDCTAKKRLGTLVLDEAHLFTQWADFRPQYRELSKLRRELLTEHPDAFTTLCMSATIGAQEMDDLIKEFGNPDDSKNSFVVNNVIRKEPSIWIAPDAEPHEREKRLLEAVDRLPRPLLLYVTKVDDAAKWVDCLKNRGYSRVVSVTGETGDSERANVLKRLKLQNDENLEGVDIVVATKAFGLGIDCEDIRSVIHACVPETVDRWYQEIGRAGRDGHVSVALILPAVPKYRRDYMEDDYGIANRLGPGPITIEKAKPRWEAMFARKKIVADSHGEFLLDLKVKPDHLERQTEHDFRWNQGTLQSLERLEIIQRQFVTDNDLSAVKIVDREASDFSKVKFIAENHLREEAWWEENWEAAHEHEKRAFQQDFELMKDVIQLRTSVCSAISKAYRLRDDLLANNPLLAGSILEDTCGECPLCRQVNEPRTSYDSERVVEPSWAINIIPKGLEQFSENFPFRGKPKIIVNNLGEESLTQLIRAMHQAGIRWFGGELNLTRLFGLPNDYFFDREPQEHLIPPNPSLWYLGSDFIRLENVYSYPVTNPFFFAVLNQPDSNHQQGNYSYERNAIPINMALDWLRES